MTNQKTYPIPFDDTIDRLTWFMRDGLKEAIAEAMDALKEFPNESLLSVQIRIGRETEKETRWNHTKERLETILSSLHEALEDRLFAAMDNTFIPYPRNSGESESFEESGSEARAFEKIRKVVYPHLILLAKKISEAEMVNGTEIETKQVGVPCHPTPVTPETTLADLLKDIRAENAR